MNASSRKRLAWSAATLIASVLFIAGAPTIGQTILPEYVASQPCPTSTANMTTTSRTTTTTTQPFPPTLPPTGTTSPTTTTPTATTPTSCPPTNTTYSTSFTFPPGGNTTANKTENETGGPEGEGGGLPGFTVPAFIAALGLVVAASARFNRKKA